MKRLLICATAIAMASAGAFALEDEPDELNWDTLGGSVTGFAHFAKYCADNPGYEQAILHSDALDSLDVAGCATVRVTPDGFEGSPVNSWGFGEVGGIRVLNGAAGHTLGWARCGFEIPKAGLYRVWVKYWHETNSVASFSLAIEDGRIFESPDQSVTFVQNAYNWRFDWSEWMRKNRLPTRRDEPSGWVWEAGPMARFEAGKRTLTLSGLVHDGPFAARQVAEVVLTENPFGDPDEQLGGVFDSRLVALWNHRPAVVGATAAHKALWREWRKAFLADIIAGSIPGVEAGRMASYVYFDDESNLIGPPADVAAEKQAFAEMLAAHERGCFQLKIEGEDFELGKPGWWKEPNFGSSGGKVLAIDAKGGDSDACAEFEVPADGTYQIWPCYLETEGKLSKFIFAVEDGDGNRLAERVVADNVDYSREHPGRNWVRLDVALKAGVNRLRVIRNEPTEVTRRLDAVIITDNPDFTADGFGLVATALDPAKRLTVWRESDPWRGFTRSEGPKAGEDLSALKLAVREGEAETVLLLARNNTAEALEIFPKIENDPEGLVMWRVPAFMQSGWVCGWQPMPLLRRDSLFIPAGQTAGIWLTIEGRRDFSARDVTVDVGGEKFVIGIARKPPLAEGTPVPYVLGWSTPYPRVSTWEYYRKLGMNVIGDTAVPADDARRYGIRLNVIFNDTNVSEEHIRAVRARHEALGYRIEEWAWSFMDEPGNAYSDQWVELAKKFRSIDPDIKIWVNPGEIEGASPKSNMKLTPWVNYYCPYHNHWTTSGWGDEEYFGQLMRREGPKFEILMGYTTPCFIEKAPTAPKDMLYLKDFALKYNLDGWAFFAFTYAFTYCNSPWDDQNNYLADQAVSLYQGAGYETISTRNAEAIREAVQQWRECRQR